MLLQKAPFQNSIVCLTKFVFSQIVYSSGLTIIAKLHLTDMPSKRAAAGKHVELHSRPDESI